jgi:hypothetical protein
LFKNWWGTDTQTEKWSHKPTFLPIGSEVSYNYIVRVDSGGAGWIQWILSNVQIPWPAERLSVSQVFSSLS